MRNIVGIVALLLLVLCAGFAVKRGLNAEWTRCALMVAYAMVNAWSVQQWVQGWKR